MPWDTRIMPQGPYGIKMWALKWKIDNIPCGKQDCSKCVL